MHLGVLTSWPMRTTTGSGVVTSVQGFIRGLEGLGVEVGRLEEVAPARSATGTLLRRLRYNRGLPRRILQARGLDALLGFDWDGFRLDRLRRPPLTVFCGGTLADILRFESGWARRLLAAQAGWEGRNLVRADAIAVPSRYAAETVRRCYGEGLQPEVVPLAVDVDLWDTEPTLAPPTPLERPLLLSVARLYRRKGIDLVLRAWDRVRRQLGSGTLVVVGSGPESGRLRALTAALGTPGRVILAGAEERIGALKGWYRAADLFCLPSRHETFGLVFLEAGLQGVPSVALATTAVTETVRDGETGLLVPSAGGEQTVRALAGALRDVLRDDGLRTRLGVAASVRARSRSWREAAAELRPLLGP